MRGPLVVSLAIVATVIVAGAYGLGLFDASEPAPAAAPASQPGEEAPAAAPAPAPESDRPAKGAERLETAPAIRTPLPAATTATLRIDSDVPGADVFIDNTFAGTVPATIEDVQPGHRKISVSAPGHATVGEFHDIKPGPGELMILLKTLRLDRKIAVTHRHRFGSCSGTLIATADGLRYETDKAEDAFSAGLLELETFEADFLEKNLKVGIRGGRSYDFTDPAGTADALYLFYQEVEKVRQRLLKEGEDDGAGI
jgi:hypothetical protein